MRLYVLDKTPAARQPAATLASTPNKAPSTFSHPPQAVDNWLSENAMTMDDLAKRRKMAGSITAYSLTMEPAKLDSLAPTSAPLILPTFSSDW